MKRIAVIGASYLQRPLVEKAKEMGLYVLCFAWRDGAVCEPLADEFYPISIVEKEQILEICRQKKIDGICTIASDVAAPTVAFVAEKMGLVGNSYESAVRANNKFAMRDAFMKAGVPCPKYTMVDDIKALSLKSQVSSLNSFTFPFIVKPTDRSGSLGVTKVNSEDELLAAVEKALDCSFKHQAMVEEFIEGCEISVEFISYRGTHYPLTITDKVTTEAPHFVELEHHQPSTLTPAQYEEIYAFTRRALDALGVTDGASHSEYKITKDGRICIMEIGARMGGDFIGSDLVRLSTGYDFVMGVIDVALGTFEAPVLAQHKCAGVYFLCKDTEHVLPYILNPKLYSSVIRAEQTSMELSYVSCSADRSGYFIYQGNKKMIV